MKIELVERAGKVGVRIIGDEYTSPTWVLYNQGALSLIRSVIKVLEGEPLSGSQLNAVFEALLGFPEKL